MNDTPDVRLQSSVGDVQTFDRKDQAMKGMLMVARILKIHHVHHTADIQMIVNRDVIVGTESKQGIDAVQILEQYAGWDKTYEVYYGDITPYRENELVLVAFAENMKDRPFILGAVHEVKDYKNPFPKEEYDKTDEKHIYQTLKISRLQDYWYFNGVSELELVHHSHSYLTSRELGGDVLGEGDGGEGIDDSRDGFNWDDLYVKNFTTEETLEMPEEKYTSVPLDYMLHFARSYEDDAGFLRFWVRSKTSEVRITSDNNDSKLTIFSLKTDGSFKARRQNDTNKFDSGSDFGEVEVKPNGDIIVQRKNGAEVTKITITAGTLEIETTEVIIKAKQSVTVTSPDTDVYGNFTTHNGITHLNPD
ncbi:MAG: hypothetical protein NC548_20010 [Lachnospiraceae bacterium]|nr:hypothetical protein [Lachnospiraceae bacterium]